MLSWGYIWRLWTVWVKKIVTFFFLFSFLFNTWKKKWGNCQPSWLLHRASLAARTDPGDMRTRCGTKHSISASDITAVSSAVSACAINSVVERADCLCRKYLTPDPKP